MSATPSGMPQRWPAAYASPLAKRIAAERGIDLRGVRGSGPAGRIVRGDVPNSARLRNDAASGFMLAIEADAAALLASRADRWAAGERPSLGDIVADAARHALRRQDLDWPVTLLDDAAPVGNDALAVLDLTAFGITAFTPPHLPHRAVLAVHAPPASALLHLSLAADARDLSCHAAARFLAALRATLEAPPAA